MLKITFEVAPHASTLAANFRTASTLWQEARAAAGTASVASESGVNVDPSVQSYAFASYELMSFPWPLADQSVSSVKLEWGLELLPSTEQWLKVVNELYRICADGALVEFKAHSASFIQSLDLPFNLQSISENRIKFLDKSLRQQVLQSWWGQSELIPGWEVNFRQLEFSVNLVKPALQLQSEYKLTSLNQLGALIQQHPELIQDFTVRLCAVHDEQHHFALAKIKGVMPFVMQVYPWDQEHDMWVSRQLSQYHIWEAQETYLFLALLNQLVKQTSEGSAPEDGSESGSETNSPVVHIANIGANIGWYTVVAGLWHQLIKIDAFEPTPDTVKMLKHNVELNNLEDQVKVYDCALADACGESPLFINTNDAGSNSLMSNDETHFSQSDATIKLETLDHMYLEQDPKLWPQLLLIDVEGHEQKVFDGAQGLFEKGFRPLLITEFSPSLLKLRGKCSYYKDLVERYQYVPYIIQSRADRLTAQLSQVNVEFLEANYKRLADPEQNPKQSYMNVLFVPANFPLQQVKTIV